MSLWGCSNFFFTFSGNLSDLGSSSSSFSGVRRFWLSSSMTQFKYSYGCRFFALVVSTMLQMTSLARAPATLAAQGPGGSLRNLEKPYFGTGRYRHHEYKHRVLQVCSGLPGCDSTVRRSRELGRPPAWITNSPESLTMSKNDLQRTALLPDLCAGLIAAWLMTSPKQALTHIRERNCFGQI